MYSYVCIVDLFAFWIMIRIRMQLFFCHVMLPQVVIFVMNKNKDNSSTDEPLVRFADLYHSANRTPMSSHDVTRHLTTWHIDGNYYPGIII